jgi:hypothetical protein
VEYRRVFQCVAGNSDMMIISESTRSSCSCGAAHCRVEHTTPSDEARQGKEGQIEAVGYKRVFQCFAGNSDMMMISESNGRGIHHAVEGGTTRRIASKRQWGTGEFFSAMLCRDNHMRVRAYMMIVITLPAALRPIECPATPYLHLTLICAMNS